MNIELMALLICMGFDLGGFLYYQGKYQKFIKFGFAIALIICLLAFNDLTS